MAVWGHYSRSTCPHRVLKKEEWSVEATTCLWSVAKSWCWQSWMTFSWCTAPRTDVAHSLLSSGGFQVSLRTFLAEMRECRIFICWRCSLFSCILIQKKHEGERHFASIDGFALCDFSLVAKRQQYRYHGIGWSFIGFCVGYCSGQNFGCMVPGTYGMSNGENSYVHWNTFLQSQVFSWFGHSFSIYADLWLCTYLWAWSAARCYPI